MKHISLLFLKHHYIFIRIYIYTHTYSYSYSYYPLNTNIYIQLYLFNKYLKYPFFSFFQLLNRLTLLNTHIYTHFKHNTLTILSLPEAHTTPPLFLSLLIYTKTLPSYSVMSQNTHNTSFFTADSHTYTKHHHTYSITNTHVTLSIHPCCPTPKHIKISFLLIHTLPKVHKHTYTPISSFFSF